MAETTPANIADELSDEFNSSIWTFYQTIYPQEPEKNT